jgi:hypothetical protein
MLEFWTLLWLSSGQFAEASFTHLSRSRGVARALGAPPHRFQAPFWANQRGADSRIELGIQTAQWLLSNDKRGLLKSSIISKFPFVPEPVVDASIRVVAAAFKSVAPETLKIALLPGGMEKLRPVLKQTVVDTVLKQDTIKKFSILSDVEKARLISTIVDGAIDQIFQDAEWVLLTPEERLEALYEEIRLIQKNEMTSVRLALYMFRRHPYRYLGGLVMLLIFLHTGRMNSELSFPLKWHVLHNQARLFLAKTCSIVASWKYGMR